MHAASHVVGEASSVQEFALPLRTGSPFVPELYCWITAGLLRGS